MAFNFRWIIVVVCDRRDVKKHKKHVKRKDKICDSINKIEPISWLIPKQCEKCLASSKNSAELLVYINCFSIMRNIQYIYMVTSMYLSSCKKGNGKNYLYIYNDEDKYINRLLFTHEQAKMPILGTWTDAWSETIWQCYSL